VLHGSRHRTAATLLLALVALIAPGSPDVMPDKSATSAGATTSDAAQPSSPFRPAAPGNRGWHRGTLLEESGREQLRCHAAAS